MVISDELKSRLAANDFSSVDGGRSKDANTQRLLHKNATRLALAGITSLEEANKIAATKS
jgi:HPt (histidine-containing phosphotransfer) domain-containing protein